MRAFLLTLALTVSVPAVLTAQNEDPDKILAEAEALFPKAQALDVLERLPANAPPTIHARKYIVGARALTALAQFQEAQGRLDKPRQIATGLQNADLLAQIELFRTNIHTSIRRCTVATVYNRDGSK